MKDRDVQYANRYKLSPVSGTSDTYDFEAVPGTVTEAGTDINKANLLPDFVVAALGITAITDPQVADALYSLKEAISTDKYYWDKYSYQYVEKLSASANDAIIRSTAYSEIGVTVNVQYSNTISFNLTGTPELVNPNVVALSYSNASANKTVLNGKYFTINSGASVYKGTTKDIVTDEYMGSYRVLKESYAVASQLNVSFLDIVWSFDSSAFPTGVSGDFYYASLGKIGIPKISYGSFVGTGASPLEIMTPFPVKAFVIYSNSVPALAVAVTQSNVDIATSSLLYLSYGNTKSISYNSKLDRLQIYSATELNTAGAKFNYLLLG